MATSQIVTFAASGSVAGGDVLSAAEYAGDSQTPVGNQVGIARREFVNTALRQACLMASGVANYIVAEANMNVNDIDPISNPAGQAVTAIVNGLTTAVKSTALGSGTSSVNPAPNILVKSDAEGNIHYSTTGQAATAAKLTTARNVSATGLSMTATTFDGSQDLTLAFTGIPGGLITSGTISPSRIPLVTYIANGLMSFEDKIKLDSATSSATTAGGTLVMRGLDNSVAFGHVTSTAFIGNGTSITGINASNLSTGTVDPARLPLASATQAGAISPSMFLDFVAAGVNIDYKLTDETNWAIGDASTEDGFYFWSTVPTACLDFPVISADGQVWVWKRGAVCVQFRYQSSTATSLGIYIGKISGGLVAWNTTSAGGVEHAAASNTTNQIYIGSSSSASIPVGYYGFRVANDAGQAGYITFVPE